MIDFENVRLRVDDILKKWGEKGIVAAGDSGTDWIFKGHKISGDELSGSVILVDKSNGEMRLFNAGRRRDRDVTRTARPIKI